MRALAADRRVPWTAKLLLGLLALYLLNPIDLIPDVVPVIGYLDDIVIAALILGLVARIVPPQVWREHMTPRGSPGTSGHG